ncbi:MAG: DUF6261 family protein [Chitinispirillaceae bacterium]
MLSFPISYLNSSESLVAGERFYPILADMPSEKDEFVSLMLPVLKNDLRTLSAALGRDYKSEYTSRIDQLDAVFNTAFVTFRDFNRLMMKQEMPEVAKAAAKIINIIEVIDKSLHGRGYTEQLANASVLINELRKEENQNAIDASNSRQWYENMVEADSKLRAVFLERNSEKANCDTPNVKEAHKTLNRHLESIYSHIDIMNELVPEKYSDLASRFEEVVKSVISSARARLTRKENESGEETREPQLQ